MKQGCSQDLVVLRDSAMPVGERLLHLLVLRLPEETWYCCRFSAAFTHRHGLICLSLAGFEISRGAARDKSVKYLVRFKNMDTSRAGLAIWSVSWIREVVTSD